MIQSNHPESNSQLLVELYFFQHWSRLFIMNIWLSFSHLTLLSIMKIPVKLGLLLQVCLLDLALSWLWGIRRLSLVFVGCLSLILSQFLVIVLFSLLHALLIHINCINIFHKPPESSILNYLKTFHTMLIYWCFSSFPSSAL